MSIRLQRRAGRKPIVTPEGLAPRRRLTDPDEEAAEAALHQSIAVAQEQGAKLWELRAAISLARLWRDQGRRTESYELLTLVYSWFTEGFDTADLKEAKALLDVLPSAENVRALGLG